jgi:hypothetical protein
MKKNMNIKKQRLLLKRDRAQPTRPLTQKLKLPKPLLLLLFPKLPLEQLPQWLLLLLSKKLLVLLKLRLPESSLTTPA